jgi:putative oxidoreductase
MVNANNQTTDFWYEGVALVRITMGVVLIFHGWQLFESHDMKELIALLFDMAIPFAEAMAYTANLVELGGGFFLILGLFTRIITALLFCTFMFNTFVLGDGRIFTENEHPFLLAMISLLFFFTGAGRFSIDYILSVNRREDNNDSGLSVSKKFGRYVSKS